MSKACLGLVLSVGLVGYTLFDNTDLLLRMSNDPKIKELYSSEANADQRIEKIREMYGEKIEMQLKRNEIINKIGTIGFLGSAAYFLLGTAIPAARYVRKKKSLEKQLTQTNL